MKGPSRHIGFVVTRGLCTCCGACAGICPQDAVGFAPDRFGLLTPAVDEARCTGCGTCVKVCPGYGFDFPSHWTTLFGGAPAHPALGHAVETHAGHATDPEILRLSQSGGLVSALLLHCLEAGIIRAAVVTRAGRTDPFRPETFLARTREEILSAAGSKPYPVPADRILSALRRQPGPYAFVGTPCQVHGMRKAEAIHGDLAGRIALYLGLHCLGVFTYHHQGQLLHTLGLRRSDVTYFRYRDKAWRGWEGDLRLQDTRGRIYDLDAENSRLWPRPYFTAWRCLLCPDKGNEFSDISCGDCRIREEHRWFRDGQGYDLRGGLSDIVVRTARGREILARAVAAGALQLHPVAPDALAASLGVAGKKLGYNSFRTVARWFGAGVPEFGVVYRLPPGGGAVGRRKWGPAWTLLAASHYYLVYRLSSFAWFRRLLQGIPHRLLGRWTRLREARAQWARCTWKPGLEMVLRSTAATRIPDRTAP